MHFAFSANCQDREKTRVVINLPAMHGHAYSSRINELVHSGRHTCISMHGSNAQTLAVITTANVQSQSSGHLTTALSRTAACLPIPPHSQIKY